MIKTLVTGAAGFIGYHLSKKLAERGDFVTGVDNLNSYYDLNLKLDRLKSLRRYPNFSFKKIDIAQGDSVAELFCDQQFEVVVNLAAQPGVRYSLQNPHAYIESNIVGFVHILEGCRHNQIKHLVYASSSSVYGGNTQMPFSVNHNVDHPVSLYAATKKSNELLAHTYSSLYGLPTTGLRFFTVYGPWGRPDMAYFSFTKSILESKPITIYNYGKMQRDFTYVDDVVEGIMRVMDKTSSPDHNWSGAKPDPGRSFAPYRIYNIGNNRPIELMRMVELLEQLLDRKAIKKYLPMQAGDILATYADIDDLLCDVGYRPQTTIEEGLKRFVDWYKDYYGTRIRIQKQNELLLNSGSRTEKTVY